MYKAELQQVTIRIAIEPTTSYVEQARIMRNIKRIPHDVICYLNTGCIDVIVDIHQAVLLGYTLEQCIENIQHAANLQSIGWL